ncbi:MAG: TrkH family potassium uptake protein [Nanoarchaeota archaeon]|nr:TrkH family potassium uptake protein [Nanoarchaeota archaeon]MBU4451377.1 TrkH family potassium uptake protein [Nanoarchaeota archaeon]
MNLKVILRDTGVVVKYSSISFLFPIFAAIYYGEYFTIKYFFIAFLAALVLGDAIEKVFRTDEKTLLKEGLMCVSLIWLIIPLVSAIPYIGLANISLLESLFETMSAWTTTGFSILVPETLPKAMLFFRSVQQWFGGVGIVVIAIAGVFNTSASLYYAEARNEKIKPNILGTIKMIWWIYAAYTVLGILLLFLAGMTPFDAINHSMTAIATGGLSTHSESIAYYNSPTVEFIIMLIMVIGSISFLSHYDLLTGNLRKFFSDVFVRSFIILIIIGTAFVYSDRGLRTGIFTVVSAASSTGFNLDSISAWHGFSYFALIILMIVGGNAGATASGIKINRVLVALKSLLWSMNRIRNPRQIFSKRIGDVSYTNDSLLSIYKFMMLYLLLFMLGTFVFLYDGYGLNLSMFQSASALGNSGLSVISTYGTFSMSTAIFLMWAGRLEIWAALTLLIYIAVKSMRIRLLG